MLGPVGSAYPHDDPIATPRYDAGMHVIVLLAQWVADMVSNTAVSLTLKLGALLVLLLVVLCAIFG